jgi:hypothetical protein
VRHWADGGETSLENLVLLCSHHHKLVHEGGFGIRRDVEGEMWFRRPDGRVIPRHGYSMDDMCDDFTVSDKRFGKSVRDADATRARWSAG